MFLNQQILRTQDTVEGFAIVTEVLKKLYSNMIKFKILGSDMRLIFCTLKCKSGVPLSRDDIVYLKGRTYKSHSGAHAVSVSEVHIVECENDIDVVREALVPYYYKDKIKLLCQQNGCIYNEPASYKESKEVYSSLSKEG